MKSDRIHYPQIVHFGTRIILNWRQSNNSFSQLVSTPHAMNFSKFFSLFSLIGPYCFPLPLFFLNFSSLTHSTPSSFLLVLLNTLVLQTWAHPWNSKSLFEEIFLLKHTGCMFHIRLIQRRIHLFSTYLLSLYCVQGMTLDTEGVTVTCQSLGSWRNRQWWANKQTASLLWWASQVVQSAEEPACHCIRHKREGFDPWVRKIPWRRKWQPTPVFLPGKFHGQRRLVGHSTQGHTELDMTEQLSTHYWYYNRHV